MSNAELYDEVLKTLHDVNGGFNAAARNWIEGTDDAPFEDEEAKELYAKAKYYCRVWRSNAINSRISKTRMIECVRQIAEKGLHNPYKEIDAGFRMLGVTPDEVKLEDEPEAIQGTTLPAEDKPSVVAEAKEVVKNDEPEHILGVVPEEKPGLFKRKKR